MIKRVLKAVLLWGGLFLVLAGIVYLVRSVETPPPGASKTLPRPVDASDHIKGNPNGSIELVEYGDFQCPACRQVYPALSEAAKDIPDLKVVYRHFPLKSIHRNATISAQVVEAAGKQGKFWEMHDLVFNRQDDWDHLGNPREVFEQYAKELQLDAERFAKDVDAKDVKDRVERDFNDANGAGLSSTPTFFLQGKSITLPTSYDAFKQLLLEARNP